MGHAAAHVVVVAAGAEIDIEPGGGFGVLKQTRQQANPGVALAHEHMAELMANGERAQGADRVREQRMRAVERIDVTRVRPKGGPTGGLDGARELQGKFIKVLFPVPHAQTARAGEAEEVSVSADVVKPVVVDADMADVGGHVPHRGGAAELQEAGFVGGVELNDRRAILESLGPFGPTAGGVLAAHGEDGSP